MRGAHIFAGAEVKPSRDHAKPTAINRLRRRPTSMEPHNSFFLNSQPQNHHSRKKDRKAKMSELPAMAWGPTAGGGGKLNTIKMINAGPYRGGLCEFGHRVPGPVPRPVPNSFSW